MKAIFQTITTFLLLVTLVACSQSESLFPTTSETRTVIVKGLNTKTSIGYEGSDYSHLIWLEGDEVAYVTNCADDLSKAAVVIKNEFKAEIPAAADSQKKLLALWPATGNEGKTLANITTALKHEITQNADDYFDGNLLPMYAVTSIPTDDIVDAQYKVLGSVIRLSFSSQNHENETLKSVTLIANEDLIGVYKPDVELNDVWSFEGNSKEVRVKMEGSPENLLLSNEKLYVYMVVNPNQYTGVRIVVETDANTYEFKDGAMNLHQENKTLYRIHLNLDESGPVPPTPKDSFFVPVRNISEITSDGSYLIVTDNTQALHLTPCEAATSEIDYLAPTEVTVTDNGILKTEEIMQLTWKITLDGEAYTLYSNKHQKYVQAPGGISTRVYGHIWLEPSIEEANYDHVHYDIHVSNELTEIALRHVEAKLQYFTNSNNKMFCFCRPEATDIGSVQDITIYKLAE